MTTSEAQSSWYSSLARPDQHPPPGDWRVWLILAGRGWGKTRTGAEWVRSMQHHAPRMAIVAPTFADARDTCIEGESGLRSICADGEIVKWNRSLGELEFRNGATVKLFSGDKPDRLRGPQHHAVWFDELAAFQYPAEAWAMAMFGLRLGDNPRAVITTTPRPIAEIKRLLNDPTCHVTRGTTYDNRANLAEAFFAQIVTRYEGTRLGRQELNAEILDDAPGALWNRAQLDRLRVVKHPDLTRVIVGVDPAASATDESDETGIVAAGVGSDGEFYVLDDRTLKASPHQWASAAVTLYYHLHADRIVAEVNQGGDMVESTIRTVDPNVSYRAVHASRGKVTRAEPIAALYEQGRVHHVGTFAALEDQMCEWEPGNGDSPDRVDALVWALTELNGASWLLA